MKNKKNLSRKRSPLELEVKLKAYKKKGEKVAPRVLFSASVPQCLKKDKNQPYGRIFVYDDMTEKDVIQIFRDHKKDRVAVLEQYGDLKRKHITKNAERDHIWTQMAKRYKQKPYEETAKRWVETYPNEAMLQFAGFVWANPDTIESLRLKALRTEKLKHDFLKHVSALKPTDTLIADDFSGYVLTRLPKAIRSAIRRYQSTNK